MEDISSMWKYLLGLFAAIAALVLLYRFFYQIDGFESDPLAGKTPCDSSCSGFGYGKKTGRPCCRDASANPGQVNPASQADCPTGTTYDGTAKQCLVCTKLGDGTTQCRSGGAYDAGKPDPKYHGSINEETVKTDVLTSGRTINYADWLKDPKTNTDLTGSGGDLTFFNSTMLTDAVDLSPTSEDDVKDKGISSGKTNLWNDSVDKYYEDLAKGRIFTYDNDSETNQLYTKGKNDRKTAKELIDDTGDNNSKIYNRFMERPSEMSYDEDEDVDYYDEYYDEYYDDEEGFVTGSKVQKGSKMPGPSKMP
jgi:hypothetical protein